MSLRLALRPDAPAPLHVQIRRGIREAVQSGVLRPGERLSGIRALAEDLGVNRLTVLKAIRGLARSGVVTTIRGKGVFVANPPPGCLGRSGADLAAFEGPFFEGFAEGPAADDPEAASRGLRAAVDEGLGGGDLSFSSGFPPPGAIPVAVIRARLRRLLSGDVGAAALGYASTAGDAALHAALGTLLERRGLPLRPDDHLLVTGGAQQAIVLCLEALLEPGEALAIESPGYVGAIAACRLKGISMAPVPVDHAGLNPERLESALRRQEVGAVYTVPSFQNPTGVTQGRRRREQILEIAGRHGALVIEDDTYADLRFGGRGVAPIKSLPGGERVVYVGSFSKSLAPGLRLGFLVASGPLAEALRRVKEVIDISTPALTQALLADLLRGGLYRRHLGRVRRDYRRRRDAMIAALGRYLPPGVRFTQPRGGMHLWVMPDRPLDVPRLLDRCRRAGVTFAPGALFFCDGRRSSSFRLNFCSHPPERIEEGVRRLARCIAEEIGP